MTMNLEAAGLRQTPAQHAFDTARLNAWMQNHIAGFAGPIEVLDAPHRRAAYLAGDFPRAELVKDLDKRYRWDLAYAAGVHFGDLYDEGLNDTHIDTALRMIVPPLILLGSPLLPLLRGLPRKLAREGVGPFLVSPALRQGANAVTHPVVC